MPDNELTKTEIAFVTMGLFPQSIRGSALEDRAFREELGLSVDAVIRLDKSGQQFDRSKLFAAVRQLFADSTAFAESSQRITLFGSAVKCRRRVHFTFHGSH